MSLRVQGARAAVWAADGRRCYEFAGTQDLRSKYARSITASRLQHRSGGGDGGGDGRDDGREYEEDDDGGGRGSRSRRGGSGAAQSFFSAGVD